MRMRELIDLVEMRHKKTAGILSLGSQQAYEEGVYAKKTGKPETACPYVRNQELRSEWLRGWASYGVT